MLGVLLRLRQPQRRQPHQQRTQEAQRIGILQAGQLSSHLATCYDSRDVFLLSQIGVGALWVIAGESRELKVATAAQVRVNLSRSHAAVNSWIPAVSLRSVSSWTAT